MIIDSNIFIDFLRNKPEAITFIESVSLVSTSVVVATEILSGAKSRKEFHQLMKFLDLIDLIEVSKEIAFIAGEMRRTYYKSHGVTTPDCLIAATAVYSELPIASLDKKHFSVLHPNVFAPY